MPDPVVAIGHSTHVVLSCHDEAQFADCLRRIGEIKLPPSHKHLYVKGKFDAVKKITMLHNIDAGFPEDFIVLRNLAVVHGKAYRSDTVYMDGYDLLCVLVLLKSAVQPMERVFLLRNGPGSALANSPGSALDFDQVATASDPAFRIFTSGSEETGILINIYSPGVLAALEIAKDIYLTGASYSFENGRMSDVLNMSLQILARLEGKCQDMVR